MALLRKLFRFIIFFVVNGLIFSVLGGLVVYIMMSLSGPPSRIWHEVKLEEEFDRSKSALVSGLPEYYSLEERLFAQMDEWVYAKTPPKERGPYKRYHWGSRSDPNRYHKNWNRTYEMPAENPVGGVLMLHGLSDSPYSMRAIGESFQGLGFQVLALRIPGHGTVPAGLLDIHWEDWAAAVRIGARYLADSIGPDRPLYFVGYSNGAALSVQYALSVIDGEKVPRPAGLILVSPAIGVPAVAVLARFQSLLSSIPGLEKLAWQSLLPEFDPYKYNSFSVNAGAQIYDLSQHIERTVNKLRKKGKLSDFPPTLGFVSVVDATVPAKTLVDRLLLPIGPGVHELVIFDVNRFSETERYFLPEIRKQKERLLDDRQLPFRLTVITNIHPESKRVHAIHKDPSSGTKETESLPFSWPAGIYSLSHVALPFPPDDPIYGIRPPEGDDDIYLGKIEIMGERGILQISPSYFTRIRYNPFFGYLEQRIREFVTGVR